MKFGILGFGNLGQALATGLILSDSAGAGDIYICDSSPEVRLLGENDFCSPTTDDVNVVIANSDILFLTVKSHVFEALADKIDKRKLAGKTVVSFMAGMQFEKLQPLVGDVTLVRAMPSLSIASCEGVIGYTKAPLAVVLVLKKLGLAIETAPENIERFMAFSACGLGYVAYLIDAYTAAGETMGFAPDVALQISSLLIRNALDRGDFRKTVKAVATPGGATEQGIQYMDECGVYGIVAEAIQRAYDKMA